MLTTSAWDYQRTFLRGCDGIRTAIVNWQSELLRCLGVIQSLPRQLLGDTVNSRCEMFGSLSAHGLGRLDRQDISVLRFVRPRARTDVENGAGVTKRPMHPGGNPWIGATLVRVAYSMSAIVNVACQFSFG